MNKKLIKKKIQNGLLTYEKQFSLPGKSKKYQLNLLKFQYYAIYI